MRWRKLPEPTFCNRSLTNSGLPSDGTGSDMLMKSLDANLGYRYHPLADIPVNRDKAFGDFTTLTNWSTEARAS